MELKIKIKSYFSLKLRSRGWNLVTSKVKSHQEQMKPHNSIIKYNADTEIAQKYVTLCGGQELEEEVFVHDIDLNRIPNCAGQSE
jgi:hypothetical protein